MAYSRKLICFLLLLLLPLPGEGQRLEHPMNRISRLVYEEDCGNTHRIIDLMKNSSDESVRAKAAFGLGTHCFSRGALSAILLVARGDSSPTVRSAAFGGAAGIIAHHGMFDDSSFIDAFLGISKDDDNPRLRRRSIEEVFRYEDRSLRLAEALKDALLHTRQFDLSRENREWSEGLLKKMDLEEDLAEREFNPPIGVLSANMNLREQASTKSQIMILMEKGTRFSIYDEKGSEGDLWYFIKIPDGEEGWFCGRYKGRQKYSLIERH